MNIPGSDRNAELLNPTVSRMAVAGAAAAAVDAASRLLHRECGDQQSGRWARTRSRWTAAGCMRSTGRGWGRTSTGPIRHGSPVPASYYPNFRYTGGIPAANQARAQRARGLGATGVVGMDEDYDACDLENWFLAIQSADGQVMIPSFHRPAIIRVDVNNNINDWTRTNQSNRTAPLWADSAARILRPRQADGHDAATFKDLTPDPNTGQIQYDVDNDGDGNPDSVWLDLGYPARKDASGRLYKPLFAFMVIGLNGRIPLNTAGNLAAQVAGIHAE